jgi:hypothetical protein
VVRVPVDLRDRRKIPVEFRHIDDVLPRWRDAAFLAYAFIPTGNTANASHDDVAFDAEGDVYRYRRCEKGEEAELSRLNLGVACFGVLLVLTPF